MNLCSTSDHFPSVWINLLLPQKQWEIFISSYYREISSMKNKNRTIVNSTILLGILVVGLTTFQAANAQTSSSTSSSSTSQSVKQTTTCSNGTCITTTCIGSNPCTTTTTGTGSQSVSIRCFNGQCYTNTSPWDKWLLGSPTFFWVDLNWW